MKVALKTLERINEENGFEGQLIVRGFLQSIFDKIANKNDWKGEIDVLVHVDLFDADLETIRYAVMYFTGNPDCSVTLSATKDTIHIKTAGYRAGPCG